MVGSGSIQGVDGFQRHALLSANPVVYQLDAVGGEILQDHGQGAARELAGEEGAVEARQGFVLALQGVDMRRVVVAAGQVRDDPACQRVPFAAKVGAAPCSLREARG
jgi:hypothetical protein